MDHALLSTVTQEVAEMSQVRSGAIQSGRWLRLDSRIVVLLPNPTAGSRLEPAERVGEALDVGPGVGAPLAFRPRDVIVAGQEFSAVFGTGIPSRRDLIHPRIDFHAQEALHRMFKGPPSAQGDAREMFAAVRAGQLVGIYIVNEGVPAMRARKMNTWFWQLIPERGRHSSPGSSRPDGRAATYRLPGFGQVLFVPPRSSVAEGVEHLPMMRSGEISRCKTETGVILAESPSLETLVNNVVPPTFCYTGTTSIGTPRPPRVCTCTGFFAEYDLCFLPRDVDFGIPANQNLTQVEKGLLDYTG
jgi:hypothetical protein